MSDPRYSEKVGFIGEEERASSAGDSFLVGRRPGGDGSPGRERPVGLRRHWPASAPGAGGTRMMVIKLDLILSAKRCFPKHLSGASH